MSAQPVPTLTRRIGAVGPLGLTLLLPLSVFWPLGTAYLAQALPMYVTPGLYLSDIWVALTIVAALCIPSPRGRGQGEGSSLPSPSGRGQGEGSSLPSPSGRGQGEGLFVPRNAALESGEEPSPYPLPAPLREREARGEGIQNPPLPPLIKGGKRRSALPILTPFDKGGQGGILLYLLPLLALLSTFQALSPGLALYSTLRWLLAAGLFMALVRSRLPIETLATVFLAGMGLQAVIGIAQFFKPGPLGLPGELALPIDLPGAPVLTFLGALRLRAYGLTFNPNVLGGFLGAGLVLGLPLVRHWPLRAVWWLCGVGLLLTFSRSAWLATAVSLPLAAAWLAWKCPALRRALIWTLGPVGLGLAGGLLFFGGELLARFNLSNLGEMLPLSGRGELIRVALDLIGAHPLLGVGAGNFPLAQALYPTVEPPEFVHNVPLLLASEIGVLGGLIWLWLWLAPGLALERLWKKSAFWPGILVAAWFGWGIVGLWDSYPWSLEAGRLFSVFLLALIAREMEQAQ